MKLFLIVCLFIFAVCIAIIVYKIFRIRYLLFKDLSYIISQIKNNVTFNKNSIDTILSNVSRDINKSSLDILKGKSSFWSMLVTNKERHSIRQMFESLGRGDVNFEMNNLEYHKNIFDIYERSAKESFEKKAMMYFKLIIGFGLIFCIILI